jgi:toxoflavin synthase
VRVENDHLSVAAHEDALRRAGFREVTWRQPQLSPHGAAEGDGYWSNFLDHSPVIFMECKT